jgi:hypothetical protein
MSQSIVYIDTSAIREGKLQELESAMKHLAGFLDANVPRLLSYGFYLDGNRTRMTVVAIHPDSASLEYHLDVGGSEFGKFASLIELLRIEVYGYVSQAALDRLRRKAEMLRRGTVVTHELYAGFTR